jgi:chondroitin 4-sulfotransferase 11
MRLQLAGCLKYCAVVGLIYVCLWLSLVGLTRDNTDQEEVTSSMTRTVDKQERSKTGLFKLNQREQARRVKHVRDVCRDWGDEKHGLKQGSSIIDPDGKEHLAYGNEVWHSSVNPDYQQHLRLSSFLVERKHLNISYCWIHKVASTSWQTLFLQIENITKYLEEDKPYQTMFRMAPKSSKEFSEISKHFFNFLVVRHPFHRLVSAYRDRVEGCKMKGEWYIKVADTLKLSGDPNCYVEIDTGKILFNKAEKRLKIPRKGVVVPTFQQFVQFLLQTAAGDYNQHWRPYFIQCTPCIANLSAVVKLESAEQDEQFVLELSGLERVGRLGRRNEGVGRKTEDMSGQYFGTLDCQEVLGLYKIFSLDFILFEYDQWQFIQRCRKYI